MTLKHRFRMTASELAMGRYMRAPDHTAADDEFSAAFTQFGNEPAAGAADDKGGKGDGAAEPVATGEPGGAAGGAGDGGGADDKGGAAPAADDKGGAPAAADGKAPAAADDKGGAPAADDKGGGAGGNAEPAAAAPAAAPADDKGVKTGKDDKAPAAAAAPAGESDDDVLKRLAAAVKKVDVKEDVAPAAQEPAPLFSDEENAKIEHFRKEWPEVAEAFDLQARALAQSVLKYAFEQIGGVVNPMRETLDVLATRTHYGDLKEKVGEYSEAERQEIIDWVGTQPKYLQAPMLSVIEEGTAEEVGDLVGRYRQATGKQPAGAPAATAEPAGGDVELSEEAKKAAAALAPVSTKRSTVTAPDDKSDYNGAFAKFVDELG
jgi:hypothetical protein